MQWDDLRVFLGVARTGQFLAAGRSLKLDHATVSRRVSALERDLKARLFVRRTTGVMLTAAGERLLGTAERMESEAIRLESDLTDRDFELSGTVRVGAPDDLSTYYLAQSFAALARQHPGIVVQLVPTPQLGALGRRDTDITVALEKPQTGRYVTAKLTDYTLGIFAHPDYLAGRPDPDEAAGLAGHRLIGSVPDYAYSSALDYVRTLFDDAPMAFQCTSAIGRWRRSARGWASASSTTSSRLGIPSSSACCRGGGRGGHIGSSNTRTCGAWGGCGPCTSTSWPASRPTGGCFSPRRRETRARRSGRRCHRRWRPARLRNRRP